MTKSTTNKAIAMKAGDTERKRVTSTKMAQTDININLAKSSAKLIQPKVRKLMLNKFNNSEISPDEAEKILQNFGEYLQKLENTLLDDEDTQAISEATTVDTVNFIQDLLETFKSPVGVDIREKRIAGTMNRVDRLLVNKNNQNYNVIIEDKKVSYGVRWKHVVDIIGSRKLEADYLDNTLANIIEKQVGQYNNKNYQVGLGSITIVNNGLDYYVTIKKTVLNETVYNGEEDTNLLDGTKAVYEVHPGEIWKRYYRAVVNNDTTAKEAAVLEAQREFTVLRNIILAGTQVVNNARQDMLKGIAKIYSDTYKKISVTPVDKLTKKGIEFSKVTTDNSVARLFGIMPPSK